MSLLIWHPVIFELKNIPEYIHSDTQYPFQPKIDNLFIPSILFIQIMERIYKIKSTRTKKYISTNMASCHFWLLLQRNISKKLVWNFLYTMVMNAC